MKIIGIGKYRTKGKNDKKYIRYKNKVCGI